MDSIKGAIQLRELLDRRAPNRAQEDAARPEVAGDALPLFHWTGVQPPAVDEPPPEAA